MEKFDYILHWKKFLNKNLVVNCPTEELANEFLAFVSKKGFTWGSGTSLLKKNYYKQQVKDTCYRCTGNTTITYAEISYYQCEGYEIVVFKGF